jgi:predicted dehydrogenase
MAGRLHWGILGAARVNRHLIPALHASARSTLVAVASRDRARAEAHAVEWRVPRGLEGYRRLLDDPAIDAVYIPLPNSEHVRWTIAALEAGKHVLCEKPLALDPADVDRVSEAARAAGRIVEEAFTYRHEGLTARVLAILGDGAIGAVRAIVSGFTYTQHRAGDIRLDPALGGGALWDVGCYAVGYATLIARAEPKLVVGAAHWSASGVDEEFAGLLRYPAGVTASIYAGFRAPYRTWLELIGTEGALTVSNPFRPSERETLELERPGRTEQIVVAGSALPFARAVADFEAAVLDGAPPVISLAESRHVVAALSQLHRSARDQTP